MGAGAWAEAGEGVEEGIVTGPGAVIEGGIGVEEGAGVDGIGRW